MRGTSARLIEAIGTCRDDVEAHLRPLAAILDALAERVRPLVSDGLGGEDGQSAMKALARLYLQWERYPEAAIVAPEAVVSRWVRGPEAVEVNSPGFDDQARGKAERCWREQVGRQVDTVVEIRNDIGHGLIPSALATNLGSFKRDFVHTYMLNFLTFQNPLNPLCRVSRTKDYWRDAVV